MVERTALARFLPTLGVACTDVQVEEATWTTSKLRYELADYA